MKPTRLFLLTLLIMLLVVPAPSSAAAIPSSFLPGELLVRLRPGVIPVIRESYVEIMGDSSGVALSRQLAALGATSATLLGVGSDTYHITIRADLSPIEAAALLSRHAAVIYAEPNYRRVAQRIPNDTVLSQQWGLYNIQAFDAWDITTGTEIVIAVLDTGVDQNHPDLDGKVIPGFNAFTHESSMGDDNGHGTAVSGLIAAHSDNEKGIAGICWGCWIMPVKVLDRWGRGNDASVALGIHWAVDHGARIINMSLGGTNQSQTLEYAVDYALARGVLMVAASGNEHEAGNAPTYPAAYDAVIAVGSTGNTDVLTSFSNTGPYIDLAAPGVGLWTTLAGGGYGSPNGTSFSSAYIAGAAALVFSLRPDLPALDIKCILEASADDKGALGRDDAYGWGRLNVLGALHLAQTYTNCPLTRPTPSPTLPPDSAALSAALAPIPPESVGADRVYFPETGHSLGGEFRRYWEQHGGLPIFGYPLSEEFNEMASDGVASTVQYFERYRFEFHPNEPPPYNVLLARIGDDLLRTQGRDWTTFPKTGNQPGCLFFEQTGQAVCAPFLGYWRSHGLEFDGQVGTSYRESLALFGQPISALQVEEVAPGVFASVQWFERARFEDHGTGYVLLGLLGNQLLAARGWR